MIKSELIRGFVGRYILHDYPAFMEVPLLPQGDQVDIVKKNPSETDPPTEKFFVDSTDKGGNPVKIQVFHVLHNDAFTEVDLIYKATPEDKGPTQENSPPLILSD